MATVPSEASPNRSPRNFHVEPIRVAVVGCGAVSRQNHLPILAGHERLKVEMLVDLDRARASELARAYGVAEVAGDLDLVTAERVDAVVLATPPAHHAKATVALAGRGLHVFVEKPMATSLADAETMVAAADAAGVALSVGLYRRTLPAVRLLRSLVASGEFGEPLSVDIEEGGPYGWQLTTLDVLTAAAGGGGVLIDIGSHVLDVLFFVLPGRATLKRYADNARGGIETDCLAEIVLSTERREVPVRLELSRTRELRNSIRIECEEATLELLRGDFIQLRVHRQRHAGRTSDAGHTRTTISVPGTETFIGYDGFRAQIDGWLRGIVDDTEPDLSGRSVLPVVEIIERCYQFREPLAEPWTDEGLRSPSTSAGPTLISKQRPQRVLVTGAGGFLGGRTVELLSERYGYETVALIKEPKGAARLARWPKTILLGDVCLAADMDRAMSGCDAVVHCAVGTSWDPAEVRRVTVDGTRTVAEAAARAGVKRFVHISSMAVHRHVSSGVVDEQVPLEPPSQDAYGQNKLAAELVLRKVSGLSTIILRPARVYGPFSKTFTVRPLAALTQGRLAISGDPEVPANMVYVDNVVDAIVRAIEAPSDRSGRAYLINDPDQFSLRAFFNFFGEPSGAEVRCIEARSTQLNTQGLAARWVGGLRTIALSPEVRALVHRVMDTDPVGIVPRWLWDASPDLQRKLLRLFKVDAAVIYRPRSSPDQGDLVYYGDAAVVSGDRARQELGVIPVVPRERAMALTLTWAQYARLLPPARIRAEAPQC